MSGGGEPLICARATPRGAARARAVRTRRRMIGRMLGPPFLAFYSPRCFSLETIVRYTIDVGGELSRSARNALQINFFEVARMRADPARPERTLRSELRMKPPPFNVPNSTV